MRHDDASSDSDSGEDYYLQNDGPKFGNNQNEQQNFTNADMYDSRIWNVSDCEEIISSHTNPVGKFLRGMNISAIQAVALNLMPYLMEAPNKPREKYGQRKAQTKEEKIFVAKERNREHARRTRRRRSVFKKVTEACKLLTSLPRLPQKNYEKDDTSDNRFSGVHMTTTFDVEEIENRVSNDTGMICDSSEHQSYRPLVKNTFDRVDIFNDLIHNERKSNKELISRVATLFAIVLDVDRLILHDQSKECDAEPYVGECRSFYIKVNNFTGTLPPILLLNGHHFNEARSTLQILLNQLQEELVLKLLLPTEPSSPSPNNSFGENRILIPFSSTKQNNCEESRPLLQGFKRLFNFSNPALDCVQEPHSNVNSQNANPQREKVLFHPFSCSIENDNQENFPLPRVIIDKGNDYNSILLMESLLPISPICGNEDITSVQLDRLQVNLDPLSEGNLHQYEGGVNMQYDIIVIVDYRIKVPGFEDTSPSTIEFCDKSGDSFVVRSATIRCVSLLESTSPATTTMTISEGINEPLTAAINVTCPKKNYEIGINLDYSYIQAELMRVVRDTLRKMPVS